MLIKFQNRRVWVDVSGDEDDVQLKGCEWADTGLRLSTEEIIDLYESYAFNMNYLWQQHLELQAESRQEAYEGR